MLRTQIDATFVVLEDDNTLVGDDDSPGTRKAAMAAALIQTYGAQAFTAVNGKGELQHHVRSHVCEVGVFVQIVDSNQDLSSRHRRRVVLGKYQPKDNLREVARDMLLMLVHSRRIDLDKPTDGVAWLLLCMDSPDNMTYNLFAFVFRSNDVDALMSSVAFCVGLALVLRSTHADARVTDLGPRLLVQMHPKSTETCAAFGLLLHESLLQSGAAALGASVNGVGLEVLADCAKLVNALESDAGLPAFARFGDRALSSVFTFCTVNNDCKGRLRHLSFTYMLSVLRGGYYNRAVAGEGGVALLSAVGGSAIDGRLVAPVFSVSVRGASVLWHIACAVRPRTLNPILARHGDCVEPMQLSYNHVRGFGRIGLESPPAPAPYAWWCLLSCVILIVRQVAAYRFEDDPRPRSASAADEVRGTSCVMSDNNQGVKPEYSVVLEGVNAKAGITSAAFKEAATRRFGDAIMTASFSAGFPFDSPRECIFAASKHNGKEPLQTVATSDLLKDEQALLSQADLQQWVRTKKWQTSATLKAVAWATLQQHHRPGARTMTSCTPSELVSSLMADDETWTTAAAAERASDVACFLVV